MAGFTPDRRSGDKSAKWSGPERRRTEASRGLASRGIAEMLDPTAEEAYWRENYDSQPFYERGYGYEDYHPAYRVGWEGRCRFEGKRFDDVEPELAADYQRYRGQSRLEWERCRPAARAAWDRFDATDPFERGQ